MVEDYKNRSLSRRIYSVPNLHTRQPSKVQCLFHGMNLPGLVHYIYDKFKNRNVPVLLHLGSDPLLQCGHEDDGDYRKQNLHQQGIQWFIFSGLMRAVVYRNADQEHWWHYWPDIKWSGNRHCQKICQERVGSTLNVERRSLTLGVAVKLALFPMIGSAKILIVKRKEYQV